MQPKLIVYKRIKNLGNYESEHLEMSAEIEENEHPTEAATKLIKLVNDLLNQSVYPRVENEGMGGF